MQREFLNYKNRYFIILNRIQTHNSQINGLILQNTVLSLLVYDMGNYTRNNNKETYADR